METSKHSTGQNSGAQLTLLPEGSHASLHPSQAKEKAQAMIAGSGRRCLESFARLSPSSLWVKMFLDCLLLNGEWYSSRSALTWRLRGMKSHRLLYFQLVALTRRTSDTAFGLLPTPTAAVVHTENLEKLEARRERIKAKKINGNGFGPSLNELAQRGLLPTPVASDANGGAHPDYYTEKGRNETNNLATWLSYQTGEPSQLNHRFVLEMMGYPPDWCDLPSKEPGTR
jgi:hypothetical protein